MKKLLLQCTQHGSQKKTLHGVLGRIWLWHRYHWHLSCPHQKKRQEIPYQTLQGQGKGPTVGMKWDRVKRKQVGTKNRTLFDLAETQNLCLLA